MHVFLDVSLGVGSRMVKVSRDRIKNTLQKMINKFCYIFLKVTLWILKKFRPYRIPTLNLSVLIFLVNTAVIN